MLCYVSFILLFDTLLFIYFIIIIICQALPISIISLLVSQLISVYMSFTLFNLHYLSTVIFIYLTQSIHPTIQLY